MKLGLCQMPVTASKAENGAAMRRYVRDAAAAGCDLVALPEMWCCPYSNAAFVEYAEPQCEHKDPAQVIVDTVANKHIEHVQRTEQRRASRMSEFDLPVDDPPLPEQPDKKPSG